MELMLLWMLWGAPAALAQEVGPDPTAESPVEAAEEAAEAAPEVGPAPAAAAESAADVQAVDISVQLANGMTLKGTAPLNEVMIWSKGDSLHFTPAGGVEVVLGGEKILQIFQGEAPVAAPVAPTAQEAAEAEMAKEWADYVSPGGFGYPNPAASRYLYAPSAIPLEKGQGYVSQKLAFTAVAYAPTDNISLLMGTFTFWPPLLTVLGGKAGVPVGEKLHVGVGAEAFMIPIEGDLLAGVVFGSVTYGHKDKNFTVASGVIGGNPDYLLDGLSLPVMVGAQVRLSDRAAFVTENWVVFDLDDLGSVPDGPSPLVVTANSAVVRLLGKRDTTQQIRGRKYTVEGYPRTTWDFGLLMATYRNVREINFAGDVLASSLVTYNLIGPFPWVDYTWHFGVAQK
jgi:hypothetical protein